MNTELINAAFQTRPKPTAASLHTNGDYPYQSVFIRCKSTYTQSVFIRCYDYS